VSNNPETSLWRQTILPSLSLFTSTGTLICCALPALLVTLGMGASLAGFVGVFPWITAISEYKVAVFAMAGIMLSLSAWMQWRARHAPCPADARKAKACMRLRKISWGILVFSIVIYVTGIFFAFFAADIFYG
jgi:magnesium-transporting ATPase (P-type)